MGGSRAEVRDERYISFLVGKFSIEHTVPYDILTLLHLIEHIAVRGIQALLSRENRTRRRSPRWLACVHASSWSFEVFRHDDIYQLALFSNSTYSNYHFVSLFNEESG